MIVVILKRKTSKSTYFYCHFIFNVLCEQQIIKQHFDKGTEDDILKQAGLK